jgi:hypothetical protein
VKQLPHYSDGSLYCQPPRILKAPPQKNGNIKVAALQSGLIKILICRLDSGIFYFNVEDLVMRNGSEKIGFAANESHGISGYWIVGVMAEGSKSIPAILPCSGTP